MVIQTKEWLRVFRWDFRKIESNIKFVVVFIWNLISVQSVSANNRRVRRKIAEILFELGPMTRNELSSHLKSAWGGREVPSDTSLSSLLAKNVQIVSTGFELVEAIGGAKAKHMVFDINRQLIKTKEDIIYSRPVSCMTPSEKRIASRCSCGRRRVFPPESDVCIHCLRPTGL